MIYPEAVEVNGTEYAVKTSYLDALACIACINDPDIGDIERAFGVLDLLYIGQPPDEDMDEAVRMAVKYLLRGQDPGEPKPGSEPDMDYEYDMHYIRSSFRSDYGIDLSKVPDMHWWEFSELLQGLTDKSVLNRVRDLRNFDISQLKDMKARAKITRAQREVALPIQLSQEDQDTIDDFYAQLK